MTEILIVEDEKASSDYLIELVNKNSLNIKILSVLNSVESTIHWLEENKNPDLIFMDVQLSDGISFEVFNNFKITSPVIFVTAYDEYAIRAFKTTSIDYLLKPINALDLNRALTKYYENKIQVYQDIEALGPSFNNDFKERFLVKEGNKYIPIKTEDIAYFYWSDYAFIKTFNSKSFLVNYSLSQLEELIAPHLFIRINRQIIANVNAIESITKQGHSYYIKLIPKFMDTISISKESYLNLKRQLS